MRPYTLTQYLFKPVHQWFTGGGSWRVGILIGVAVTLAKLPLLFTTLGEDDQGRMIMDALVYLQDGRSTVRTYGVITSPLWTLSLAGIAKLAGTSQLVWLTNIGGWLCGGLITTLSFVLLRQLGASRAWSAAGAIAGGLVPGTFYLSLYGYPSQYGLALLLVSTVAFAACLRARGTISRWALFTFSAITYCLLALMKVDFALSGAFLFSVALIMGKQWDRKTWLLPTFVAAAVTAVYAVVSSAVKYKEIGAFKQHFQFLYPWESGAVLDAPAVTVLYACGFGMLGLFALTLISGIGRRSSRSHTIRQTAAWLIGVIPLWLFWLAHPPMSSRHAAPGVLMTVLIAALMASRVTRGRSWASVLWLLILVGANWPFGEPRFDFNYRPSGNLRSTLANNRDAFAVCEEIADFIARRPETMKVILGPRERDRFGGIDFIPIIEVALAARAQSVSSPKHGGWGGYESVFTGIDGKETKLYIYIPANRVAGIIRMDHKDWPFRDAGFYAPLRYNFASLTALGIPVFAFDAEQMFEKRRAPPE